MYVIVAVVVGGGNMLVNRWLLGDYSQSYLSGHSRRRTALITAALTNYVFTHSRKNHDHKRPRTLSRGKNLIFLLFPSRFVRSRKRTPQWNNHISLNQLRPHYDPADICNICELYHSDHCTDFVAIRPFMAIKHSFHTMVFFCVNNVYCEQYKPS